MDRCVHQPGGVVEKERFFLLLLDKLQRVQAVLVGGNAILVQAVGIILLLGGKPANSVGHHLARCAQIGARPVESLVLGLGKRVVVNGHMPLAAVASNVAVFLQQLGQGHRGLRHAAGVPWRHHRVARVVDQRRVPANHVRLLRPGRMVTTHDGTASRSTGGSR